MSALYYIMYRWYSPERRLILVLSISSPEVGKFITVGIEHKERRARAEPFNIKRNESFTAKNDTRI